MFDIHITPLNRQSGQVRPELPGVFSTTPPRRCGRGRDRDNLVMLLSPSKNSGFSTAHLLEILSQAASKFYDTPGTITSALGAAANFINDYFLSLNLKNTREGIQVLASLSILVIRNEILFLAQAGPAQAIIADEGQFRHYGEDASNEPPLGTSKNGSLRFHQAEIKAGSLVLLTPMAPETWNRDKLIEIAHLPLPDQNNSLYHLAGTDIQALIVSITVGKGLILRHRLNGLPADSPAKATAQNQVGNTFENNHLAHVAENIQEPAVPISSTTLINETKVASQKEADLINKEPSDSLQKSYSFKKILEFGKLKSIKPPAWYCAIRDRVIALWSSSAEKRKRIAVTLRTFLLRMLPGASDESPKLPKSALYFIAVAIPIVVAAIAITIYLRSGRGEQHLINLQVAQYYAGVAAGEKNRELQHDYWTQAEEWLDKAESYGSTPESKDLRKLVQAALDSLDGVSRLILVPALPSDLPRTTSIKRIAARDQDVYLLDDKTGNVIRLTRKSSSNYEIDFTFVCGPGGYIGKIVDIAALPPNNIQVQPGVKVEAKIIGVDEHGNAVYCAPGANPTSKPLARPKVNWDRIQAINLNQGILYVLDSGNNQVWRYRSGEDDRDFEYSQAPGEFFDASQLTTASKYIDLAVNVDNLFLLHEDSQMTHCVYSRVNYKESECRNPAIYQDMRSGSPVTFATNGLKYSQLSFAELPDSALYILEENQPAVYKYGMQLNLYRIVNIQMAEGYSFPKGGVTAFTVSTNQIVFLAFGKQLYYARIP